MQLQLHENKTGSLTRLSPNCTEPIMPRHSMTFSRRQNKHLKTPATLETSGSTSAVSITSSFSLEGYMRQLVDAPPWSSLRQEICFTPIYRNHAFRTGTHQSSDNPLCSNPAASITQARWELLATCAENSRLGLHTGSQKMMSKMKPFLASPQ